MKIICQICSSAFEACSRAKYCSGRCKKRAWYNAHKNETSFKAKNIESTRVYRKNKRNTINQRRRERFQHDVSYQRKVRQQTVKSRSSKPQSENNRVWRLNHPYKAMMKNLRKRGKRLVDSKGLQFVFQRDNGLCQYCGSFENLSLDHKIPVSRGGDSSIANLCVACIICNSKKGNKTPEEFLKYLEQCHASLL